MSARIDRGLSFKGYETTSVGYGIADWRKRVRIFQRIAGKDSDKLLSPETEDSQVRRNGKLDIVKTRKRGQRQDLVVSAFRADAQCLVDEHDIWIYRLYG